MKKTKCLKIYLLSLFLSLSVLSGCHSKQPEPFSIDSYSKVTHKIPLSETIFSFGTLCYDFIKNNMTSPKGGIYTNLKRVDGTMDLAQEHEIFSESMGLLLEFAILRSDPELYKHTLLYISENMVINDILLGRIEEDQPAITQVSATIDDLRIY